jgi:hypothetical protein
VLIMVSFRTALRTGLLSVVAASALMAASGASAAGVQAPGASMVPLSAATSSTATPLSATAQRRVVAGEDAAASQPAGTFSIQATTGRHTLCRAASVRAADKAHVLGYAQSGDTMDVDHYATHTNPQGGHSLWAYGVVHAAAGAITGYVLYEDGTFC